MRRVVVTGVGLVTPLGTGQETVWNRVLAGDSGLGLIDHFETEDLACRIAGLVPRVDGRGGGHGDMPGVFDPDETMSPRDQKRVDDFIIYGIAAADQAIADSGWTAADEEAQERAGVLIGSGIGGLQTTTRVGVGNFER